MSQLSFLQSLSMESGRNLVLEVSTVVHAYYPYLERYSDKGLANGIMANTEATENIERGLVSHLRPSSVRS